MAETKKMTVKQYAGYRGISRQMVYNYVNRGQLARSVYTVDGKTVIDRDLADRELFENLDQIMNHRAIDDVVELPSDALQKIREAGCESLTLEEAQRLQAHFKAELLKLEYGVKTGKLVYSHIVERKTFNHARGVRDSILLVPGRVAPEIPACTTVDQVKKILTDAMTEAMTDLDTMPDYTVED